MATRGSFKVAVTKEDLVFAAAHFITLPGHRCEALHGHNYRAGVTVEGALDPEGWYVLDFTALKRAMKQLTEERQGTRHIYRAQAEGLQALRAYLEDYWGEVLSQFVAEAKRERKTPSRRRKRR